MVTRGATGGSVKDFYCFTAAARWWESFLEPVLRPRRVSDRSGCSGCSILFVCCLPELVCSSALLFRLLESSWSGCCSLQRGESTSVWKSPDPRDTLNKISACLLALGGSHGSQGPLNRALELLLMCQSNRILRTPATSQVLSLSEENCGHLIFISPFNEEVICTDFKQPWVKQPEIILIKCNNNNSSAFKLSEDICECELFRADQNKNLYLANVNVVS